jgi:hypothetical protein
LITALPEPVHVERKGRLLSAEETASYRVHGDRVAEYQLRSDSGLVVNIALRTPAEPLDHRPLMLLMGGQETGCDAVDVLRETHGVTVAAISYPFGSVPHRSLLDVVLALPRIQRGIFDTPAAALLALDFLLSPDAGVNPGRVELAGISFGAYLAAVPAVLDARVERLWLIHGGGAAASVLEHGLQGRVPLEGLRRQLARYLATVAGARHLSSEHWVADFSPRPLVVVNAMEDGALPARATEALHSALREPYEILWTPGKHVHPKRPEVVLAITRLMFDRLASPTSAQGRVAAARTR